MVHKGLKAAAICMLHTFVFARVLDCLSLRLFVKYLFLNELHSSIRSTSRNLYRSRELEITAGWLSIRLKLLHLLLKIRLVEEQFRCNIYWLKHDTINEITIATNSLLFLA
jgi:hypothetical protein